MIYLAPPTQTVVQLDWDWTVAKHINIPAHCYVVCLRYHRPATLYHVHLSVCFHLLRSLVTVALVAHVQCRWVNSLTRQVVTFSDVIWAHPEVCSEASFTSLITGLEFLFKLCITFPHYSCVGHVLDNKRILGSCCDESWTHDLHTHTRTHWSNSVTLTKNALTLHKHPALKTTCVFCVLCFPASQRGVSCDSQSADRQSTATACRATYICTSSCSSQPSIRCCSGIRTKR